MADSTDIKHITWPHELVYAAGSQPTSLLPLVVTVYLAILDTVKAG